MICFDCLGTEVRFLGTGPHDLEVNPPSKSVEPPHQVLLNLTSILVGAGRKKLPVLDVLSFMPRETISN